MQVFGKRAQFVLYTGWSGSQVQWKCTSLNNYISWTPHFSIGNPSLAIVQMDLLFYRNGRGVIKHRPQKTKMEMGEQRWKVTLKWKHTKKKYLALSKIVHESYLSTETFHKKNKIFIGQDGYYFNSGKTLWGIMWLFCTLWLAKQGQPNLEMAQACSSATVSHWWHLQNNPNTCCP